MIIRIILTFFLLSFAGYLFEGFILGRTEFSMVTKDIIHTTTGINIHGNRISKWYF